MKKGFRVVQPTIAVKGSKWRQHYLEPTVAETHKQCFSKALRVGDAQTMWTGVQYHLCLLASVGMISTWMGNLSYCYFVHLLVFTYLFPPPHNNVILYWYRGLALFFSLGNELGASRTSSQRMHLGTFADTICGFYTYTDTQTTVGFEEVFRNVTSSWKIQTTWTNWPNILHVIWHRVLFFLTSIDLPAAYNFLKAKCQLEAVWNVPILWQVRPLTVNASNVHYYSQHNI